MLSHEQLAERRERRRRECEERKKRQWGIKGIEQPLIIPENYSDINYNEDLVSIVLTHWNRLDLLKTAVKSIRDNTQMKLELIIVDNGSKPDMQVDILKYLQSIEGFEQVKYLNIKNGTKLGEIWNMGIDCARGKHLIIGNEDIEVKSPNFAERFIQHSINYPQAGAVGVCSNSSYFRQNVPINYNTEINIGKSEEIDCVSFILVYIPRWIQNKAGYIDENTGTYSGHDGDYCVKLHAYGYQTILAKDIFVKHIHLQTPNKFQEQYPLMKKKYGTNVITPLTIPHCVEVARKLYHIETPENTDAVGVWYWKGTIIEHTLKSLVKYTPDNIPIYIMEQTSPEMEYERERLNKAVAPYKDRIKIHRCFMSKKRDDAPLSILKFLNDHPEVQRLFKIDDDFIVCNDAYTSLKEAYESKPDTLMSFLLCPINIWGLNILKERVREFSWLYDGLLNPDLMYKVLQHDSNAAYKIWSSSVPPSNIIPQLRTGERFVNIPKFNMQFSIGHCFAHRDDFIKVGGLWDEPNWQKLAHSSGRPRIIDTHNLIYHLAWFPFMQFAQKRIIPEIIEKTEF